ncbi:uncharacterized protein LOC111637958 [Centruroides sculpturatus]|uniref:uncharacterized protein LOC111637958 n=1 Tax=Centruroides sculpturatus TaxID=218467 RepID=UPI000C6EB4AB|nr:uncharacterized protein LOC111637958 [Centruroides sculpturatus]
MPYIKRKFPNKYEKSKRLKSDEIEEVDMDIENIDQGRIIYSDDEEARLCKFIPPLPHDTPIQVPVPPPPPPPPPLPASDDAPAFVEETQICANLLSPTLTELEEEKQRLMNELELELEENKKDTSDETENINNCDKHETNNQVPHIILIGDYIFKNLCIKNENWKIDIYANNNWKLQNVLEYIKLEISNLTGEEIIFIHLGINDFLSRGSSSLSEICSLVKDSLNEIRTQVKILILSAILPFPHFDTVVNHKIQCLNMFIRELCKKSNLGFINLRKAFMDGNLLKSDLFEDQQYYLNENGSKIMCDVLLKNFEFAVLKSKDVSFKQEVSSCQETIEWFN